ncbi:hypothetical protein EYF80_017066 [Liparis tanakae]|uniref:Uncharacterized protein n=1 Tax=Liparis tanakae TaxID=230148 RepID=A0A4Z2I667_9TELE|nr:hypothetical protein EYF80_017066 [Liparis tanakae]
MLVFRAASTSTGLQAAVTPFINTGQLTSLKEADRLIQKMPPGVGHTQSVGQHKGTAVSLEESLCDGGPLLR